MEKKIIAAILCLLAVLPLAACGMVGDDIPEIAPEPMMNIEDLNTLAAYEEKFLNKTAEESAAIWAWAHQMVAEWNERYQELLAEMKAQEQTKAFKKDDSEYSRTILVGRNYQDVLNNKGKTVARASRTLSSVNGWAESKWSQTTFERTEYGGFKDESVKQEATGFFYVKKIDDRWFYIDPLGYPCIMGGVQFVIPVYDNNYKQQDWIAREFGTTEKWAIATTLKLKKDHGVYASSQWTGDMYNVAQGMNNINYSGPNFSRFCDELGIAWISGSTYFDPYAHENKAAGNKAACNQVMPVFHRDFPEWLDKKGQEELAPYANESRIISWACGNELPIKPDMLDRYLKYTNPKFMLKEYAGNARIEHYYETYAATVTWLRFMTGKEDVSEKDITDELRSLFLGFIYDRLLYVSSQVYRKYVPNHLFGGIRWLTNGEVIVEGESNTILARPWAARFAARHCDITLINWYVLYYADPSTYAEFNTWIQDMPIQITEWAFWTEENSGYNMPKANGQGCVATQDDRAACFEHMTLEWLDWPNVVGWSWYRYSHHTIQNREQASTTGILDDNGNYDPYLQASMYKIHSQAYNIARYLNERKK